jgi:paraquat-inducible protein B
VSAFNVLDSLWEHAKLAKVQDSLYTVNKDYLLFFSNLVRGRQPGAPVWLLGISLVTVAQVPFYANSIAQRRR